MANVINPSEYRRVAIDYSDAVDELGGAEQFIFSAVETIVYLQVVIPEVDLVNPFFNAYSATSRATDIPASWLSAVQAVNTHVISRSDFASIDEYLADAGVKVPTNWQTLSALAGYAIDDANVDAAL